MSTNLVPLADGWTVWPVAGLRSAGFAFDLLDGLAVPDLSSAPGEERNLRIHEHTTAALRSLLSDDAMRVALTWQNPGVVDRWANDFASSAGDTPRRPNHRSMRNESLLGRYVQRYCAKNDTIGFFGPLAWARLGPGPTRTTGSLEIRRGRVRFEIWAVQAVAHAWNSDPDLWPHLPVRQDSACCVVDGVLRRPHRRDEPLTAAELALLDRLPAAAGPLVAGQERAFERLRALGALNVGFQVPLDADPDAHLRRTVERVPDPAVRARLLAVLDDLGTVRAEVAEAKPDGLLAALTSLDERLAAHAGTPVGPGPGRTPGGRTPVYLDCRRDLDAVVGPDLLDPLRTPLSVLLRAASWLAGQVGDLVHDALVERHRTLRRRGVVTLADLQLASADVLVPQGELLAEVLADLRLRWQEILPGGTADAWVEPDAARRLAEVLFPVRGRRWAGGLVHSPDLLARRTEDGVRWVLGELHVALNTMDNTNFREQADDRDELVRLTAASCPPGRVVPVYPRLSAAVSTRSYPPTALDPPGHYRYWSFGTDDGHPSGAAATPATALLVDECDGELVATGDGWAAPVLECFGEFLTALSVNLFRPRSPAPYLPRVDIGDLTVCRRTWRTPVAELGDVPTRATDPAHDRLREWAGALGLPRHVFVREVAGPEPFPRLGKPFYVDFAAPVLVDGLARMVRRLARTDGAVLEVVEMLPAPEELWLTGPDGRRYTSEVRLVAVDPAPRRRPSWPVAVTR